MASWNSVRKGLRKVLTRMDGPIRKRSKLLKRTIVLEDGDVGEVKGPVDFSNDNDGELVVKDGGTMVF